MPAKHVVSFLLLTLSLGLLTLAVTVAAHGLLAGAALLLLIATWPLGGPWRWAALSGYLLGFALMLTLNNLTPTAPDLLGALAVSGALSFLMRREERHARELGWHRHTVGALHSGSERLAEARDADAVMRAGLGVMTRLDVAPHLAFVAYRQGTPMILAACGAFESHLERPILPTEHGSSTVQDDHWVASAVLGRLDPERRRQHHVTPVLGRADTQLGLLVLARDRDEAFSQEEKDVVGSFARLIGSQLGQWHAIRDLRDANELTLRSLGAALEHRDDDTGGHTARVVNLSTQLARRLSWPDERVNAVRWGAYLHDLGKLAIPDSVLHKPGPLDQRERTIIRTHTVVGYDMLQDLHFLPAETLDLVRYHHEFWNGGGYPAGLSGENIPPAARLFAIVDVYDALTNARPYKPAWTRERALQEIRTQSGRQFDPQYVEVFLDMMSDHDDAWLVR